MTELSSFQIRVNNFKCFGNDEQGFDCIKPVNLIIGRNNSGKSSLLDLIDYIVKVPPKIPPNLWHQGKSPEVIVQSPLTEIELRKIFNESTSGGVIPGQNHWLFGIRLVGLDFKWALSTTHGHRFIYIGDCEDGTRPIDGIQNSEHYLQLIADTKINPLIGKEFRRIYAERNIVPEKDSGENLDVSGDGRGVTNVIQNFINKANLQSDLVERTLLDELNIVFRPDANFTDIVCQQLDNGAWEIYLEEETKGRIPLSQSGSGLKTIILVLVYIHLVPVVVKKDLSSFVFAFEELENNLHPAL